MTFVDITRKAIPGIKWLVPGMRVKQYLFLLLVGVGLFAAGILLVFRKEQLPSEIERLPKYWGIPFVVGGSRRSRSAYSE